jgi:arylsulfatase A-like enzyme
VKHILQSTAIGVGAGLLSFLVDDLLAVAALGYWLPLELNFPLTYLLLGAAIAVAITGGALVLRRAVPGPALVFALTLAAMHLPSIWERAWTTMEFRLSSLIAAICSLVAVLGYGLWLALLVRLVPAARRPWPLIAGTLTMAVIMTINRNLVDLPTAPVALVLDALVLLGGTTLAVAVRWLRPRGPAAIAAAGLVVTLIIALLPAQIEPPATPVPPAGTPNLVLVVIDTLRQDVFQAVVDETEEGQALRRVLDDAGWFSNLISVAPWTAPTVGTIMTGLYPPEHGFGRSTRDPGRPLRRLAATVPTLAERLAAQGYLNAGLVTNSLLHPHSGISRGFHHYQLLAAGTVKLPLVTVARKTGIGQEELYQSAGAIRRLLARRIDRISGTGRPFFLWLHLMDPHAPLHRQPDLTPDAMADKLPELDRLYRDETRYALREVAAMLELIRARADWQQTMVVLVADHGEMLPSDRHDNGVIRFGEPLIYGHGHALYEELVNVPLVIRPHGGISGGRSIEVLASQVDLLDTILDLLGSDAPRTGRQRISLAPWLAKGNDASYEKRRYSLIGGVQHGPKHRAIRTAWFKLITYPEGERPDELYKLTRIRRERRNLNEKRMQQAERLRRLLWRLWAREITPLDPEDSVIDPQSAERLKALGYLDE